MIQLQLGQVGGAVEFGHRSACPQIRLCKGETLTLRPGRNGVEVVCTEGSVWVTQTGDAGDYVVPAGGNFVSWKRGKVVVQALSSAGLSIWEPAR